MTMQNAAGRCDPVRGVVLAVLFIPQSDAPRTTTASWPYRAPRTGRPSIRSSLGAGPLPRRHGCPAVRAGRSTTGPREPAGPGRTSHSN